MPPGATNIVADARAAVAVHGIEVAPVAIQQRAAFAHALTTGQTAEEYDPEGRAAEETGAIYNWLMSKL